MENMDQHYLDGTELNRNIVYRKFQISGRIDVPKFADECTVTIDQNLPMPNQCCNY